MARGDIDISIDMDGQKLFERTVNKFEREFIKEVKKVIRETAELIQSQAKALAPVDDGALKASIEVRYFNGGLSAEIIVGQFYGIFVEAGTGIYSSTGNGRKDAWVYWSDKLNRYVFTRGQRPQPYFFPAVELGAKHFKTELKKLGA